MSFDNYYPNSKDWRKPYRKSKAFDVTCRNHGSCYYCEKNRTYSGLRRIPIEEKYNGKEEESTRDAGES